MTLTIDIPDALQDRLQNEAKRRGVSAEELVRQELERVANERAERIDAITDYVLKKNAELYRRLA